MKTGLFSGTRTANVSVSKQKCTSGKWEDDVYLSFSLDNIKVDSWWRWLIFHCSYCLCKCDQSGPNSDRYWSLRPATAEVSKNKVVTGVRFVKKDRVVHLEIQEAVALAEGMFYTVKKLCANECGKLKKIHFLRWGSRRHKNLEGF